MGELLSDFGTNGRGRWTTDSGLVLAANFASCASFFRFSPSLILEIYEAFYISEVLTIRPLRLSILLPTLFCKRWPVAATSLPGLLATVPNGRGRHIQGQSGE